MTAHAGFVTMAEQSCSGWQSRVAQDDRAELLRVAEQRSMYHEYQTVAGWIGAGKCVTLTYMCVTVTHFYVRVTHLFRSLPKMPYVCSVHREKGGQNY